jgi:hypothetical protein
MVIVAATRKMEQLEADIGSEAAATVEAIRPASGVAEPRARPPM